MLLAGQPTPIYSDRRTFQQTVTTTPTALAGGTGCQLIRLSSPSTNTAPIFVGSSGVTTTTGVPINPGLWPLEMYVKDAGLIFAVVATGTQTLCCEEYR